MTLFYQIVGEPRYRLRIASKYVTRSNQPLTDNTWLRPASGRRGVVGVIDFPGEIRVGDEVEVRVYEEPDIRLL